MNGCSFAINPTAGEQSLEIPVDKHELLSDETTGATVKLGPFGVAVIDLPAAYARRDE